MPTDLKISREAQNRMAAETMEYNASEDELARISAIKRKHTDRDRHKRSYEKTWFINGAFLRGQQYVSYNDASKTFEVPYRIPQHRVRLVINYCMAYFRRTKARLTAHKPGLFTRPATTDQNDVERARLDVKVLESELYREGFPAKHKADVAWALECGTGLMYLRWNPWGGTPLFEDVPVVDEFTGEPSVNPETGEPMTERKPLMDDHGRQLREGQNEIEVVSAYEIDVDPMATTLDDAEWIMRSKIRSLAWIRENYPDKGPYVKAEEVHLHDCYQKRIRQMIGILGYSSDAESSSAGAEDEPNSAIIHEYWERATTKYPRGRLIVIANNVELFNGENPYKHQIFPFTKTDEVTISGRFWGMAMIEQAIPLQKNLNRARSQEVENRTLMGRPKWLIPRTAKVTQASFDAEAGEKITYMPGPRGERPEIMAPPPTYQSTQIEIQHTINDIQEIFAWHEVSRGILPSANIPGVAVDKLQQADETSLGDTATNIDASLIRLGRMILSNCNQFWDEERLVRAGGEGARLEAMRVRGADLAGQDPSADYFDVRVIPGSTMLRDAGKQREMVMELIQLQILNPVAHRDLILKILDVGEIEEAFEDDRLDEQWAEKENEMMEQGTFSEPHDFENHDIHLRVLDRFRKTQRYRNLPPELQELFDVHAEMHKQIGVQVARNLMMRQAMAQGLVNEDGSPGPASQGVAPGSEASQPETVQEGQ